MQQRPLEGFKRLQDFILARYNEARSSWVTLGFAFN